MDREEALKKVRRMNLPKETMEILEALAPELAESEDERVRKELISMIEECTNWVHKKEYIVFLEKLKEASKAIEAVEKIDKYIDDHLANAHDMKDSNPDKKYYRGWDDALGEMAGILQDVYSNEKQKEQKTIEMEVYEVGKGTTICGQDYKCKKDYQAGNCWYIKDAIYHCSRGGYLNDQNGVSWSCTPEWFNEYIYTNNELAEKEKNDFVSGQFLQCKFSFDGFKEGEHYWLEYIGDDMYVGRSDNILNQKFHITPRQLYTLFSQKLEEVQGPPQEEKQASLTYEPPFNENPSDKEIIEALIKHLKEQDGFLTAINCVSTKAILSWLEKQKEQKPVPPLPPFDDLTPEDKMNHPLYLEGFDTGREVQKVFDEQKPAEWSEEDEDNLCRVIRVLEDNDSDWKELSNWLKSLRPSWKPSEEQMDALLGAKGVLRNLQYNDWTKILEELYEQLKQL